MSGFQLGDAEIAGCPHRNKFSWDALEAIPWQRNQLALTLPNPKLCTTKVAASCTNSRKTAPKSFHPKDVAPFVAELGRLRVRAGEPSVKLS